jgi:hypothetical protein
MPGNANVQRAPQPIDPPEMEGMSQDDNHLMSSRIQDIGIVDRLVAFRRAFEHGQCSLDMPHEFYSTAGTVPPGPVLGGQLPDLSDHAVKHSYSADTDIIANIPFRVEIKRVYVCTHDGCNKKYSRMPDLRRHHRGSHLEDRRFKCRALGCERAIRNFPSRDTRDVHEKKMHIDIGDGILL